MERHDHHCIKLMQGQPLALAYAEQYNHSQPGLFNHEFLIDHACQRSLYFPLFKAAWEAVIGHRRHLS